MKRLFPLFELSSAAASAQDSPPIIDLHLREHRVVRAVVSGVSSHDRRGILYDHTAGFPGREGRP